MNEIILDDIVLDGAINPISELYQKYDSEKEVCKWHDVYVVKGTATTIHPHVAEIISSSLMTRKYKSVIEIPAHQGVLTRYLSQHHLDVNFIAVGNKEDMADNLNGLPNVCMISHLDVIPDINFAILDYGINNPSESDIIAAIQGLYKHGGRLMILGYDLVKEDVDKWAIDNAKVKKVWAKMGGILFDVVGGGK